MALTLAQGTAAAIRRTAGPGPAGWPGLPADRLIPPRRHPRTLRTVEDIAERLQRVGPMAFNVVVAAGAALGLVLDIMAAPGVTGVAAVTSAVAAVGLLRGRDRRPQGLAIAVAAGVVGTALSLALGATTLPGFTEMGALLVLVSGTVRRAPPRVAGLGVVAVLIDTGLMDLRYGTFTSGSPVLTVSLWLLVAVAVGVGFFFRYLEEVAVLESTSALREERLSLARELHDGVAHHVTGMVVQAQAAQLVLATKPEAAAAALAAIERDGAATMAAVRRVVGTLRAEGAVPLAPASTTQDVRDLVAEVDRAGPRVRLRMDDAAVPPEVVPTLHRVVQESLTNARRHAHGVQQVTVDVHVDPTWVRLVVADDGRPQPPRPPPGSGGFGLRGLAERVTGLGGHLGAGPGADGGWEVVVWIPAHP